LLFQPLIEKTTIKQRLYGNIIRSVSRAALVLANLVGLDEYEDYKIDLHWPNLLPVDDLAAAQTALILKQLSVSTSTILQTLGFDPEAEAEKSEQEDAKAMTKFAQGRGMPPALSPNQQQQGVQAYIAPAAQNQPQPQSPFIGREQ
jgi:hypothetical protein